MADQQRFGDKLVKPVCTSKCRTLLRAPLYDTLVAF